MNEEYNKGLKAVITGADFPTGLSTARALALSNNYSAFYGIYKSVDSVCCRSSLWTSLYKVPAKKTEYLDLLLSISTNPDRKMSLFPCDDTAVRLISENRCLLSKFYYFVLPDKAVVDTMMDKTAFHKWATENGYLVPESYIIDSYSQFKALMEKLSFPLIIKPSLKSDQWDEFYPVDKVLKINSYEEMEKITPDIFHASENIIIQQWIPGEDASIYFCLTYFNKKGDELGYYTGKKIFQWPDEKGDTAAAVGIDNEEIHEITKSLFKKIGFSGLGSMEFKKNNLDNRYYLIEPTIGRNDLQSYVAVAGGVNLSLIASLDYIGATPSYFTGIKKRGVFVLEQSLFNSVVSAFKKKTLNLKNLFSLFKGKKSFAVYDIRDIKPFLYFLKIKLRHLYKKTRGYYDNIV